MLYFFIFLLLQQALTIVFVETKRGVDDLEYWLSSNGFPATAIHGDKVQWVSTHSYPVLYMTSLEKFPAVAYTFLASRYQTMMVQL